MLELGMVLVARGMGLVATYLHSQGQDADAMALCREAKDMIEELAGPDHPEMAPILSKLAYMQGNDPQAPVCLRTADRKLSSVRRS